MNSYGIDSFLGGERFLIPDGNPNRCLRFNDCSGAVAEGDVKEAGICEIVFFQIPFLIHDLDSLAQVSIIFRIYLVPVFVLVNEAGKDLGDLQAGIGRNRGGFIKGDSDGITLVLCLESQACRVDPFSFCCEGGSCCRLCCNFPCRTGFCRRVQVVAVSRAAAGSAVSLFH